MLPERANYHDFPSTTRVETVSGKKYIVVSHYTGKKNFKKLILDHAFKQAFAEMNKSA